MILVISYEGEEHTASVVNLLKAEGREVVQIDLADFPARNDIALSWSNDAAAKYEVILRAECSIWRAPMSDGGEGLGPFARMLR